MSTPQPLPPRGIVVTGLTVRRGLRTLIDGLDLSLESGDVLVLRGANGAGKSSLLLTLCGALRPESGTISFPGRDSEARAGTDLHFAGHGTAVKGALSVGENLRFWADLYGGAGSDLDAALADVGLEGLHHLPAGYLSAGQKQRLALARLLLVSRPIWLLDEPTAALDNAGEALVGRLLDTHSAAGGIAIVATHRDLLLAPATKFANLVIRPDQAA